MALISDPNSQQCAARYLYSGLMPKRSRDPNNLPRDRSWIRKAHIPFSRGRQSVPHWR